MKKEKELRTIDNKKVIDFLGIRVNNLSHDEVLDHLDYCIERGTPCHIVGINIDQAVRIIENEYSRKIYNEAEIVFVDSKPVMWLAQGLHRPIREKLSGPDLMEYICDRAASKKYRIFLLGSAPNVVKKAGEVLEKRYNGLVCAGTYSPPFGFEQDHKEMEKINSMLKDSGAQLLFVGMGSPKQDIFIYENMNKYGIPVSFSMGAAINFIGGGEKRAPKWMRDHGLEWFYRMVKDPKRLIKRYLLDDSRIIRYYLKYRKKERKSGRL